jgi:hypothetical protein
MAKSAPHIYALAACLLPAFCLAEQNTFYQIDGALPDDRLGVAVTSAGDVDGDGVNDLLVGARYADVNGVQDVGSAYVFSGRDGHVIHRINGEGRGDWFGVSVKGVGDIDGDGYSDLLVGAQLASPDGGVTHPGAAYVFSGRDARLLYRNYGAVDSGRYGVAVGGGYDLDGDGIPDYAVGAYGEDAVYVYAGADGHQLARVTGKALSWFGFSVALVPDQNGDGAADILVGSPGDGAGTATLVSGLDFSPLLAFAGDTTGDWFGFAVGEAGDLNRDGVSELLVGAREATHNGLTKSGSAYLFNGKSGSLLVRLDGEASYDRFGTSLDGAGDVNRDGVPDFIIGARFATNAAGEHTGASYIYSGATYARLLRAYGEAGDDWYGASVGRLGDIDADGYAEWIVGAAGADPGGNSKAGRIYLHGLVHYDVSLTALSLPKGAKVGDQLNVASTLLNRGEPVSGTVSLTVNGEPKGRVSTSLEHLQTLAVSFPYTLLASDFKNGSSTICVKAALTDRVDNVSGDNTPCAVVKKN